MIYISLDRTSSISLTKQIYFSLRESILKGTIKPNEKLPSSRELSKYLNISRNVVIDSYEQLIAEGYLYTKVGSGSYVTEGILLDKLSVPAIQNTIPYSLREQKEDKFSFRTGVPDLASIPIVKWGKLYKAITLSMAPSEVDYQDTFGSYKLREQLCLYLQRTRGVNCIPDNIMITTGAAQGFNLICHSVEPEQYALVENPLSYGIWQTLVCNNIKIEPMPVDASGMQVTNLPDSPPKLIFTTPSHQFPTGAILPIKRRLNLIQYAKKHDIYIVEDDYDSEFRYDGSPIQSMQSFDPSHVIYVGTFSKTLMPGIRLGYMILPDSLCDKMRHIKYIADLHSPTPEQLTLAKFIQDRHFDLHIQKMLRLYLKRRNHLISCLKKYFRNSVTISGANAGLHLVASFSEYRFDDELMKKINAKINICAMTKHYIKLNAQNPYDSSLLFGYGNTDLDEIEKGVSCLYDILHS